MEKPVPRRSVIVAGLAAPVAATAAFAAARHPARKIAPVENPTGAVEALMREHGVLRRCILAYRECAGRLRIAPGDVDAQALNDAAKLFRGFGEDYHQKKLEEAHIFPRVRHVLAHADASVAILLAQHARGREITDYVLSVTGGAHVAVADAEMLTRAFDLFETMYANHTAREDTIVFPAWKDQLSAAGLAEMSNLFETVERAEFGDDGFDDAVKRIADIEERLGLKNLAQFTAAPAPAHPSSAP